MKKTIYTLLTIATLAFTGGAFLETGSSAGAMTEKSVTVAEHQTATFDIAKMTCAMCPVTVKKAMSKVEGVHDVAVDYDAKTAVVSFDDTVTTTDEISKASTNAGYPATLKEEA